MIMLETVNHSSLLVENEKYLIRILDPGGVEIDWLLGTYIGGNLREFKTRNFIYPWARVVAYKLPKTPAELSDASPPAR